MNNPQKDFMKFQEWVIRFDGKIKQSEKLINSEEYHKSLKLNLNRNV